ncbi:hypothetical protein BDF20DRAFT_450163 [Mycotypha africana]|uniref:uncharacterized protein n=1 Tax=Mycotypha africana TaxID=64632 RepID=UPI002301F69E|nr:uncharacterized protein BDF20DRAFT_450163 [Mycotypha africana]KAI8982087.1 hypothetical protein BDF20DRAFT_450163 [Mycotypha africana]
MNTLNKFHFQKKAKDFNATLSYLLYLLSLHLIGLYGPKYTKSIILSNNIDQQQSAEHFTQSAILESKNMSRTIVSEHEDDTITYHKAQTFTIERPITTTTTKTTTSLQSLKPVLKKHSNVTQMLPTYSESIFSYFDSPQVLLTSSEYSCYSIAHSPILLSDYNNQTRSSISSISSSDNSSITSISSNSVSTTNKPGVHFNPEIIEIEYQPEHPVSLERSSLISARIYQDKYNCLSDGDDCYVQEEAEEEDDDDDDELWSLIAEAGASIKLSTTYTRLAFLVQYLFSYHHHRPHNNKTSKKCSKVQQQQHQVKSVAAATTTTNVSIVPLFISMMKSVVSLTTTWLLYQSLSPLTWLAKKSTSHPHHHNHTHHRRHPHRRSTATSSITTPATL